MSADTAPYTSEQAVQVKSQLDALEVFSAQQLVDTVREVTGLNVQAQMEAALALPKGNGLDMSSAVWTCNSSHTGESWGGEGLNVYITKDKGAHRRDLHEIHAHFRHPGTHEDAVVIAWPGFLMSHGF
jgi:hypothetical protein